ncbi:hypothetical protein C2S53_002058 [Perilla frutescens var. hirtella]|uniref:Uncharacterized protein n=1 Tax=Perilla frutescens var. hirtella TaxID=608512 RepID=A0AAD4IWZ3_PERFH|nr:hypothetical protein C2S53_002058 [Perilla frutescens var. hirtella]
MTPLYVLCYTIYTTFTSTILSLLLGFRLLRRRLFSSSTAAKHAGNVIALYEGQLHHERRNPVHNSFRFTTRYALIDLDRPPYSPPTFLSADEARRAANTNGPVFLLTTLPSLGYRSTPVSYYYCYDIQDSKRTFKKCIVEGTNTPWAESVTFVFNPSGDSVPKCEYISPFSDMLGNWKLKVSEPGEDLYAYISVQHPDYGNNYFIATLKGKKVNISSTTPDDLEAFFWLQPHKGSIISYWNGVKLWWKNAPFQEHPRKENAAYREKALARNGKTTQFCPAFGGNNPVEDVVRPVGTIDRCYMWKDAPWPWSSLIAPSSSH